MNELIKLYLKKSQDTAWMKTFVSASNKDTNRVFNYIDTNVRTFSTIKEYFDTLKQLAGVPRREWELHERSGQEIDKQKTVVVDESGLISFDNGLINLTKKGISFNRICSVTNSENIWLITSFYCMNASFNQTVNHIVRNSESFLKNNGVIKNIEELRKEIQPIHLNRSNILELIKINLFCVLFFYFDNELVNEFNVAADSDKEEFKRYLAEEYNSVTTKTENYKGGAVYEKFRNGRHIIKSYTDDLLTVLHYLIIRESLDNIGTEDISVANFIPKYLKEIKETEEEYHYFGLDIPNLSAIFNTLDESEYAEFLEILNESFISSDIDDEGLLQEDVQNAISKQLRFNEDGTIIDQPIIIDEYKDIDKTDKLKPKLKRKQVRIAQSIIANNFECICNGLDDRSCTYFTSRASKNNYIEGHHLVPIEYWKEFNNSIDVPANIIPLCPSCHRELHHGLNVNVQIIVKYLFEKRKERLEKSGIDIENEERLFRMYEAS